MKYEYYPIPKKLSNRQELRQTLSLAEIFIYEEIVKLCCEWPENREEFAVEVTTRQLAERLKMHRITIMKGIKKLEQLDLIRYLKKSKTKGVPSEIKIVWPDEKKTGGEHKIFAEENLSQEMIDLYKSGSL